MEARPEYQILRTDLTATRSFRGSRTLSSFYAAESGCFDFRFHLWFTADREVSPAAPAASGLSVWEYPYHFEPEHGVIAPGGQAGRVRSDGGLWGHERTQ